MEQISISVGKSVSVHRTGQFPFPREVLSLHLTAFALVNSSCLKQTLWIWEKRTQEGRRTRESSNAQIDVHIILNTHTSHALLTIIKEKPQEAEKIHNQNHCFKAELTELVAI